MPISTLIKRLTVGRPLLPSEHETNFATIEAFVNALESTMATSLNPDGTLTDGAVSTTAKLADAIVTLAKLGDFTNPNALVASNTDDPARPFELTATGNNQYLRTNETTGALEFGALPANPSLNTLLGVYTGGVSLEVPNIASACRFVISASCLCRGRLLNEQVKVKRPINVAGGEQASLHWWLSIGASNIAAAYSYASVLNANYTKGAAAGPTTVAFGNLTNDEGGTSPTATLPDSITTSNESITVLVFGNS